MNKSARSVFSWGIYFVLLGGTLVLVPNVLLKLFGFQPTNEVWIRIVGSLVLALAYYFIQTARRENTDFFQWTVYARAAVAVLFIVFVVLGLAQPMLILFAIIELLGALWTWMALRS